MSDKRQPLHAALQALDEGCYAGTGVANFLAGIDIGRRLAFDERQLGAAIRAHFNTIVDHDVDEHAAAIEAARVLRDHGWRL